MRVLLIEDERTHEILISHALRSVYGPLDIVVAPTMETAREYLARPPGIPPWNLIIADYKLPNGDSAELLAGRKAVLISAAATDKAREAAEEAGVPFAEKFPVAEVVKAALSVCPIQAPSVSSMRLAYKMTPLKWRLIIMGLGFALSFLIAFATYAAAFGSLSTAVEKNEVDIAHNAEYAKETRAIIRQLVDSRHAADMVLVDRVNSLTVGVETMRVTVMDTANLVRATLGLTQTPVIPVPVLKPIVVPSPPPGWDQWEDSP